MSKMRSLLLPVGLLTLMLGTPALTACGPTEELPEPVDDLTDPQEDPGTVPETDPDVPDDTGDDQPLR